MADLHIEFAKNSHINGSTIGHGEVDIFNLTIEDCDVLIDAVRDYQSRLIERYMETEELCERCHKSPAVYDGHCRECAEVEFGGVR